MFVENLVVSVLVLGIQEEGGQSSLPDGGENLPGAKCQAPRTAMLAPQQTLSIGLSFLSRLIFTFHESPLLLLSQFLSNPFSSFCSPPSFSMVLNSQRLLNSPDRPSLSLWYTLSLLLDYVSYSGDLINLRIHSTNVY